jgi:ABC-type phosphate transport system substrate-binding protein
VAGSDRPFAVITSPGVSSHHLTRETVALIFKRKLNYWDSGLRIQPVNLPASHPTRTLFSLSVLGQTPDSLEDYWREMYFSGVLPPHVLSSEEAVILFVSHTPGAIGYVSSCVPEHGVDIVMSAGELPVCRK